MVDGEGEEGKSFASTTQCKIKLQNRYLRHRGLFGAK
jgi:hypothetical protein